MTGLHSVVKRTSELAKAKGFRQIKDSRPRSFRSALNDPKTKKQQQQNQTNNKKNHHTCSLGQSIDQLSRIQTT